MRQLSGCDFCGGTASGTFEVLPAEYDPEGKGKRMLLCDHCRDALSSVLDPLLDAKAEREPAGDVEPDRSTGDAGGSAASTGDAAGTAEPTSDESGADTTTDRSSPADPDPDSSAEMAATGAGTSSRVPKGYRKVLRFLENREMPMDRQEAVEMTAGAYDLDEEAVDAAIDHAVGHGRLKSYDGEIRRA